MNITLPDYSLVWATSGDVLKPSDSKIQNGWNAEIPPRQWFNWIDNRQDQAIAHIIQHGIAVWNSTTEYQANTSYTVGSDGIIYQCLVTHTDINPVGDVSSTWRVGALNSASATQAATPSQAQAFTSNSVYISPLQLSNAFKGTNQSLATSGFQKFPGGLILQWGSYTYESTPGQQLFDLTFPITFPSVCVTATVTTGSRLNNTSTGIAVADSTTSQLRLSSFTQSGTGIVPVSWSAWGY